MPAKGELRAWLYPIEQQKACQAYVKPHGLGPSQMLG